MVRNDSDRPRELPVFSFCEFTNQWITFQDQVNLQYSLFIVKGSRVDNMLRIAIYDNLTLENEEELVNDRSSHTWMGLAGAQVDGYETSREAFIGSCRSYHNLLAV